MKNEVIVLDMDYNRTFCKGFDLEKVNIEPLRTSVNIILHRLVNQGARGGIYGAGASGKVLYTALDGKGINCFYDLAPNTTECCGLPSIHPSKASWGDFVLIAVCPANYHSALKILVTCLPPSTTVIFPWRFEFFDPVVWMSYTVRTDGQKLLSSPINEEEPIEGGPGSDLRGSVIFEGKRVLRSIAEQEYDFYNDLVTDKAAMRSLIDHGLIETWIAETSRRGFYLEHKPLLTHSYRNWTLEQFKDAALFFLDWWLYLYNNGFSLQDCHCLNVMFDNYQPKFVDFCSIGPKEATTVSPPFMREFFDSWIAPLAVIRTNQHQLYRELMSNRISFELSKSLCNETVASELQELYARGETFFANKDVAGFLQVMKKWVEAVQVKHSDYGWNSEDYQRAILTESQPKTRKELIVAELLDEYSPRSFLDLGCNKGRFSLLALQKGAEVVALDMAESLLDKLYRFARHTRKPLTCLYWDLSRLSCFTKPERKFDMVAYLALVHHLVFSAAMTVEEIVEQADSLCEHVLLFEYIKPDKKEPYVYKNYVEEKHPHYSLEGFRALLENRFDVVRAVDISSTRVLFVATR